MTELDLIQAQTAAKFCRNCGDECGAQYWEEQITLRSDLLWRADHEDAHGA